MVQRSFSPCIFRNKVTMAFKLIFVFAIIAVFAVDALDWKNCDDSSPVRIADVRLPSRPLRLEKSSKTALRVARAAGSRYKFGVTFWKDGRQIPCSRCTRNVGCAEIKKFLKGAQCPVEQGNYVAMVKREILPWSDVPLFMTSGKYKMRADLRDRNKRVACLEADVEIPTYLSFMCRVAHKASSRLCSPQNMNSGATRTSLLHPAIFLSFFAALLNAVLGEYR